MAAARVVVRHGHGPHQEDEDPLVLGDDQDQDQEQERPSNPEIQTNRFWFPSITHYWAKLNKRKAMTVAILVYVNLINYMDRSTVAGMLPKIKADKDFKIEKDSYLGLIQTAFVVCYMIFAPVFGYLGDRYSRKLLLAVGISFWSLSTLVGSFMYNFWWFLAFRAFVGIGEASYSVVAPAIISDLFVKDKRSTVLAIFYFAIPVGTGLGYIVGSEVANVAQDWRWGLRVTPIMGALAVLMIVFLMVDPKRGQADGSKLKPTSPLSDIKALLGNRSYMLSTVAFTCVCYCAGALMWWGPSFAFVGAKSATGNTSDIDKITMDDISFKFGIVMTLSGLLGVPIGSYVAQKIRHRVPNADPLVCGCTLLASVPILFFGFVSANYSINLCYALTFFAGLLLNANWSIVSDMTLYIVIPTRRGIASATQILVSHMFGDAFSPYLIGALADAFKPMISPSNSTVVPDPVTELGVTEESDIGTFLGSSPFGSQHSSPSPEEYDLEFRALEYSLFTCCFFQALGAFFFFCVSFFVISDKIRAERQITCNADIVAQESHQPGAESQPIYRGPPVDT